jgi:hypothetical protein
MSSNHPQINAATSGSRTVAELPTGKAKFQYYSLATPNGMKPAILLEELGIDYDAHSMPFFSYFSLKIFLSNRGELERWAI